MGVDFWANPLVQFIFISLALIAMGVVKYRIAAREERQQEQRSIVTANPSLAATGGPALPNANVAALTRPTSPVKQRENDAVQRTLEAVASLPGNVDWPLDKVKPTNIPFMSDGRTWFDFSIHDSEHAIVCGASGSGKGNLLRLLTLSVLALGPDKAILWVFDTKSGVDYPLCTRLDHTRLFANIKHADGTIASGLKQAKQEMEQRNELMFGIATNIHGYNKNVSPDQRLPVIVMVLDEFADFSKDEKEQVAQLARQGRSAGFVIIVATQYPTAEVLSSQIQANCLKRICLKVESAKRTEVSLGIEPGEARPFEPSVIEPSGVAVYKRKGSKMDIGRVPHVTDEHYAYLTEQLTERWPRTDSGLDDDLADEETGLQTAKPVWSEGPKNDQFGGLQTSLGTSLRGLDAIDPQTVRRMLVKAILDANPGISKNAVHAIVKGDKTELLKLINELMEEV